MDEIANGLVQLGFDSGWVVAEGEWPDCVVLWEHDKPIPAKAEIEQAAKLFDAEQKKVEANKDKTRETLLKRLGLTQDEFNLLSGI